MYVKLNVREPRLVKTDYLFMLIICLGHNIAVWMLIFYAACTFESIMS